MDIQEKSCRNCKYYIEHYIKKPKGFFPIGGHCINENRRKPRHNYRPIPINELCDFWECDEEKKAERRETIKTVLCNMNKQLTQIAFILKDDE